MVTQRAPAGILYLVLYLGLAGSCSVAPPTEAVTGTPTPLARQPGLTLASPAPTASATAAANPIGGTGRVLLFARNDDLWRARIDGSVEEQLTQDQALNWEGSGDFWWGFLYRPAKVSPDGRWIAWSDGVSLLLLDLGARAQRAVRLREYPAGLDWAPDSHALAYLALRARECVMHTYDPHTDRDDCLLGAQEEPSDIKHLLWSPDSRALAFSCCFTPVKTNDGPTIMRGTVQRVDTASRQIERAGEIEMRAIGGGSLCWTSDSTVVSSPQNGVLEAARCAPERWGVTLASPDGTRQVLPEELRWAKPPLPGCRVSLRALDRGPTPVALWERTFPDLDLSRGCWSPDGRYLLLDDREPQSPIWRLRADGTGELEKIVEDGFLIDAAPAWQ